jgi:hypothetical protein
LSMAIVFVGSTQGKQQTVSPDAYTQPAHLLSQTK